MTLNSLYGILEFKSFESANYAKKIMQNYKFKESKQRIRKFSAFFVLNFGRDLISGTTNLTAA